MKQHRIAYRFILTTVSAALGIASAAQAAPVTIDFGGATPGTLLTAGYIEDGFRMDSVSGHYDIFSNGGTGNSPYLGLDRIGLTDSIVEFTHTGGQLFNLLSLDVMYAANPNFGEFQILTSSAGGNVLLSTTGIQTFSGPSWTNLSWIRLNGQVDVEYPGFDSITLQTVPIPATFWLFGSGLIAVLGLSKSKRAS